MADNDCNKFKLVWRVSRSMRHCQIFRATLDFFFLKFNFNFGYDVVLYGKIEFGVDYCS